MPLYAGFDIGIKNLAFCIIDSAKWEKYNKCDEETDSGIILWKNLNLYDTIEKCSSIIKTGKLKNTNCNNNAFWVFDNIYYCGMHKNNNCKKYKSKNNNINTLLQKAFRILDSYSIFNEVYYIALETQPKLNQKMKMFATSIETYFIIRQQIDNKDNNLKFIKNSPSKNKLKLYNGDPINNSHIKNPYNKRKYLAQKHTEFFLRKSPDLLKELYLCEKKKDDLADAFLHCIYAIQN